MFYILHQPLSNTLTMSSDRFLGAFKPMKSPNRSVRKSSQTTSIYDIRSSDDSSYGLKVLPTKVMTL